MSTRETTTEKQIETFNDGSGDVGKYVGHFNGVDRTTASEASRKMASGVNFNSKFESFNDEFESLKMEKKRIESQLGEYSAAMFAKAQLAVRDQYKNNTSLSIRKWIDKKSQMEGERESLKRRLLEIDERIILIRPRVSQEKKAEWNDNKGRDIYPLVQRTNELLELILERLAK